MVTAADIPEAFAFIARLLPGRSGVPSAAPRRFRSAVLIGGLPDDNRVQTALTELNIASRVTDSGHAGIADAFEMRSDVVIVDARGCDAVEVVQKLAALPVATLVVGLGNDARLAAAVLKAGAADYIAVEDLSPTTLHSALTGAAANHKGWQENAHLAAIVAASTDAIVSLEADGRRIRTWSSGATQLFGYTEAEALGATVDELIIPENKAREREQLFKAVNSGDRAIIVETERRHKSGAFIPVEINVSPMHAPDGSVVGYSVVFRDISQRKRAAETIATREALLTSIADHVGVGFYLLDRNWRYVYANPAYLTTMGLEARDVSGLHVADVIGPQRLSEVRPFHERAFAGETVTFEREGNAPGAVRDAPYRLISVQPYRETTGQISGVIGVVVDISERKRFEVDLQRSREQLQRREAELSRAQRIARIGSYEVECRGGHFVNRRSPEYLAIHGLGPDDWNETHEAWVMRMHPDDRARSEASFKRAIANGSSEYSAEYRIIRPNDNEMRWIKVLAEIDRDADGRPLKLFGTHIDTTENKLAQDRLLASETRLRLATQAARLGLFEVDWKRQRRHWSPELRAMLAIPADLDISKDPDVIDRLVAPEHRARFRERLAASLDPAGSREFEDEHEVTGFDGVRRWMLIRGRTLFDDGPAGSEPSRTLGLLMDITERKRAEERQRLLLLEVAHRGKNQLAVVQSIARRTFQSNAAPELACHAFLGRLQALSRTYSSLTDSGIDAVSLSSIVAGELESFGARVTAHGPAIHLTAKAGQTFALVMHELATNAAKYGALSVPAGRLRVAWRIEGSRDDRRFLFEWTEIGGPSVPPPTRRGFGTTLITSVIGSELGCSPEISFGEGGYSYRLDAPLNTVGSFFEPTSAVAEGTRQRSASDR